MERYVKGEKIRIYYESKRLTTGLADVKIDIIKTDGNKEITQATMVELSSTNAPGIYYYDWVPTNAGTYLVYCDSLTDDYKRTLTDKIEIVSRSSKYAQVMGVHGGMNRVTVRDTWTDVEKQKLLDTIDRLVVEQEKLSSSLIKFGNKVDTVSKTLSEIERSYAIFKKELIDTNSSIINEINSKINTLSDSIKEIIVDYKDLGNDVKTINDTISSFEVLKNEIRLLKSSNQYSAEQLQKLDKDTKELQDNVESLGKFIVKLIPEEKLLQLKNEIEQPSN